MDRLRRFLLGTCAFSFLAILVDLYLGHYLYLLVQRQGPGFAAAVLPIIIVFAAGISSLLVLIKAGAATLKFFRAIMFTVVVVGLSGTVWHFLAHLKHAGGVVTWFGNPLLIAPLVLALPGLVGLAAVYGLPRPAGRVLYLVPRGSAIQESEDQLEPPALG